MLNITLIILSIVFLLFFSLDIIIHKKKAIKRGRGGIIFLFVLTAAFLSTGYVGITNQLKSHDSDASQKYLAVKYLAAGNSEQAVKYINILPETSDEQRYYKTVLNMIADGINGNYAAMTDRAELLKSTSNLSSKQKSQLEQLNSIAKKIVSSQEQPERDVLKTKADQIFKASTNSLFKSFKISDEIRLNYDAIYNIDEAISKNDFTSQTEQLISELLSRNGNADAYKTSIKYYFAKGDLASAEETAKKLVKKSPSVSNKIIYTDILTQRVRNELTSQNYSTSSDDPEVLKLIKKAQDLKTKASAYDNLINAETDENKKARIEAEKGKLLNEAADLNKQALLVPVKRAINYLLASKPIFGDNTGLINMQIAKLYYAADEIERSRDYIHRVLNSNRISSDSIIKNDIAEINDALASADNSGIPPESVYAPAVDNIVSKMSQNIVPTGKANINSEFKNSMVSELKYSNLQLFISRVDYSRYPDIKADVNLSGQEKGRFGLANNYSSKDFVVTDTNYRISKFKLKKNTANEGANIAVILDQSGSMQGRPFEDAKLAIGSCIDNKGKKDNFSIVAYSNNATIVSGLNNNSEILKSSVNMMSYPDGSTNISDGLSKGIDTLADASGVKAMILMSDGQDNSSEVGLLDKIIKYAKDNGIVIFTVGLGDVDEGYLRDIADQTGADFIKADNTTQLYDIYRMLQRYIVNNYTFDYTVEKNTEAQVRNCEILLEKQGVSGFKAYNLGGEDTPTDKDEYEAQLQDPDSLWINSVNPSSLAASSVDKDTKIKITGRNFDKKMKVMVGSFYSKNVKVINSGEAEVSLPEALTPGFYSVTAENPDGNRKTNEMAFSLFRPGTAKKLKVGQLTVEAKSIGKIDDYNYVASGDVVINDVIRSSADVKIHADSPKKLDVTSSDIIDLAEAGSIEGVGKVYVSYSDIKQNSLLFANIVMGGRDFIVKSGSFCLRTSPTDSGFDLGGSSWNIKIPTVIDLELNNVAVVKDGIEFTAFSGDIVEIKDALVKAFKSKGGSSDSSPVSSSEFLSKVVQSESADTASSRGKLESLSTELKFKATGSDIQFKASVEFEGKCPIGNVDIGSFKVDIDTMSDEKSYYTVGFGLDTEKLIPGLAKIPKIGEAISGIYGELSSYYVYPDSIKLGIKFDGGAPAPIKIYNVIQITQIEGGVKKLAFLTKPVIDKFLPDSFIKKIESDPEFEKPSASQITFFVGAEAELNLLEALNITLPSKKLNDLFNVAEIEDAELSIAPFKLDAQLGAKMKLLGQEVGEVSFGLNKEEAKAELQIKGAIEVFGNSIQVNAREMAYLKYIPMTVVFETEGRLQYDILGAKFDGDGLLRLSYENKIAALEGFSTNARIFKLGYNANGDVNFFKRFIVEV